MSWDGERSTPRPGDESQGRIDLAESDAGEAAASGAAQGDDPAAEVAAPGDEPADMAAPGDEPAAEEPVGEPAGDEQAIRTDLAALERIAAERDEYLDALRRLQADFENYKKRIIKQQTEHLQTAGQDLVGKLLPALDAIDLARAHAATAGSDGGGLEQVGNALFEALKKEGLERIDPLGEPFDPTEAEAVLHEAGDGGESRVVQVMRAGYRWKGRVLRPAMVKVSG
ncbi:MAG TPA: nucleotide exchange factor GrpE [Acidimicrobiales bacterium]|nr:nucleotide exchange factor GrpE [Acidimicrobiales bacterium]